MEKTVKLMEKQGKEPVQPVKLQAGKRKNEFIEDEPLSEKQIDKILLERAKSNGKQNMTAALVILSYGIACELARIQKDAPLSEQKINEIADALCRLQSVLCDKNLSLTYFIKGEHIPAFVSNPGLFVELAAAQHWNVESSFDVLADPNFASVSKQEDFIKMLKDSPGFIYVARDCKNVMNAPNEIARFEELKKMNAVFEAYGVSFYLRLTPKVMENVYNTATRPEFSQGTRYSETDKKNYPVKLAFVILNKYDPGMFEAFYKYARSLEPLIDKGYNLIYCEADNDIEAVGRIVGHGAIRKKTAVFGKKYDLLLIGGHGDPRSIMFGREKNEKSDLDLGDFERNGLEKGSWGKLFDPKAVIILDSCSTGKKMSNKPYVHVKLLHTHKFEIEEINPGQFHNVAEMIASLAKGVPVLAPEDRISSKNFIFDKNSGGVIGIEYNPNSESVHTQKFIEK